MLKVRDPNDQAAPVVAFDPRLANARLTAATAIVGTVSDSNLDSWVLDAPRSARRTFTTLASGNAPVATGTLATFDPAALANGPVRPSPDRHRHRRPHQPDDDRGRGRHRAKPDQYLRTETDLSVVLAGTTVNLVRSYDSLDRRPVGHVRLRLAAGQPRTRTSRPPSRRPATSRPAIYNPFLIGTRVYLTLPDGQRVGFTFAPVKHQINGLTYYTPAYTADPGVTYTLDSAGGPLIQAGDRFYDLKTGLAYNPASRPLRRPRVHADGPRRHGLRPEHARGASRRGPARRHPL